MLKKCGTDKRTSLTHWLVGQVKYWRKTKEEEKTLEELVASAAAAAAEEEAARGCRIENDEVPCALPRRGMWHEEMQAVP